MKRSRPHTPSENAEFTCPVSPDPAVQYTSSTHGWFHAAQPSRSHGLVAVGLGSNLQPRLERLRSAALALRDLLVAPVFSSVYETEPLHETNQPSFLNACCVGWTDLRPADLLDRLKALERAAGRSPDGPRFGPRELDLDILLFSEDVSESELLTIPHPRLPDRAFALQPLSEVAASWIHPEQGVSIRELADSLGSAGVEVTNLHLE